MRVGCGDGIDFGHCRPGMACRDDALDMDDVATDQSFDGFIAAVAHPAAQIRGACLPGEPGAIADALNAAGEAQSYVLFYGYGSWHSFFYSTAGGVGLGEGFDGQRGVRG